MALPMMVRKAANKWVQVLIVWRPKDRGQSGGGRLVGEDEPQPLHLNHQGTRGRLSGCSQRVLQFHEPRAGGPSVMPPLAG